MTQFIETLTNGIAVGSLYALIALGYTLVYGILQFINFAHSDVFALGAWLSFTVAVSVFGLTTVASTPPAWFVGLAVLMAAMDGCGCFVFLVECFEFMPLGKAN